MARARHKRWAAWLKDAAAPERVEFYLTQLAATSAGPLLVKAPAEGRRVLAALFSGSEAMGELLVGHPDWLDPLIEVETLAHPRREQGLRRDMEQRLKPLLAARQYPAALDRLREFKQREMLRIVARDLARLDAMSQITREISSLADVCLEAVLAICREPLAERFGQPYHADAEGAWQPTAFCVLGLGKLGGQELNHSSDVDVVFVYSGEGAVFKQPPRPGEEAGRNLGNHQFFTRLAEAFIAEVSRTGPAGKLFRVDVRLRPEGKAGPLVRSLESYENFYAQWGQTWERLMLLKARGVAGDRTLAHEFLELIQPFRYPRSISERVLGEVAAMKDRLETEVVRAGELDRNVKLGRGGIREIEFIVQVMQLLHGGRQPFLQEAQTLAALQKLVTYQRLSPQEGTALSAAYVFLRDLEHRLQMEHNQQTHTIPAEPAARQRLARLMGFASRAEFEARLQDHTGAVRQIYQRLFKAEAAPATSSLPRDFEGQEQAWIKLLAARAFRDPAKAYRLLAELVQGPGFVHVSPRTVELAWELVPKLLALCPQGGGTSAAASPTEATDTPLRPPGQAVKAPLSDPDRVLARLDSFISAYGARATLFEMWATHPSLFDLLLLLFDRSEFLAEIAIRTPDLVDELVLSGRLRRAKTAAETLADLRHGSGDADQRLWLRRYHQAERMRIGLRDILGLADFEQSLLELSALADACLQYALEVVLRRHKMKSAPFCIVGLGKLGGQEIDYGSDLDIIFVASPQTKNLSALQKLAVEIMDLLSTQTEHGMVFKTDARLRPDGEKGLLVNTLRAYEDYYRQRAQLWEIQTLTRTRPVAGDRAIGEAFQKLAATLSNFKTPAQPLAAWTPNWRAEIARMRLRIEKERTPHGQDALAIKTGVGGLIDAEFIAQTLCLAQGWPEANTLAALERARQENVLPKADADLLIENYRALRRIEGILRRWSYEGEIVLPDDPAPYYRVSVRCGFPTPEAFRAAVAACRQAIRSVYQKVLQL